MGEELLALVDTFDDIVAIANQYYKDGDAKHTEMGSFGYGERATIGTISCGMDGGDVQVYLSEDTEENRQKIVDVWNEISRKISEKEDPWQYGWSLFDVLDNIEFYFDIHASTSLWG
jgi:hypothetical protein